ncbi:MAG: hypothetical protein ACYC6C_03960 [Coriobacteriia bacterium]
MDNLTPQQLPAEPLEVASEANPNFLSTSRGKIIVIAAAVVGFLVIAGIVAALVFTFVIKDAAQDALTDGQISQVTTSTAPVADDAQIIVEPALVPLSDLFTFRDIFDPLLTPVVTGDGTGTGTGGGTTGTGTDGTGTFTGVANTLYLLDIVVEDGVTKAVMSLNGAEYRLARGETIPDTPWQVLSIGSSSVVMLYGDSQVTLSVGQGVVDSNTSVTATATAK